MSGGCSGVAQLAAIILAAAGHAQAQAELAEQLQRLDPIEHLRRDPAIDRLLQTGNPVIDTIGPDILGDGGAR